jgi:pectin methylesterase-like acyl-CoA thioesterase
MEYKDLGNGRVIKQATPRTSEPLPNSTLEMRMVSDSARAILAAEAIVGTAADVTYGRATHSTIQSAVDSVANGGRIFVTAGTYTESVTINKRVNMFGVGYDSVLAGTLSFTAGAANFSKVTNMRFTGSASNVTINASYVYLWDFHINLPASINDLGTSNAVFGISI